MNRRHVSTVKTHRHRGQKTRWHRLVNRLSNPAIRACANYHHYFTSQWLTWAILSAFCTFMTRSAPERTINITNKVLIKILLIGIILTDSVHGKHKPVDIWSKNWQEFQHHAVRETATSRLNSTSGSWTELEAKQDVFELAEPSGVVLQTDMLPTAQP